MKWKVFHVLGAFIMFENCFSRVRAQVPKCTKMDEAELKPINDEIEQLRKKNNYKPYKVKSAENDEDPVAAVILHLPNPAKRSPSNAAGFIYKEKPTKYEPADTLAQIKKWIADGQSYKYTGNEPPTAEQKPYVQMLWKAVTGGTCAKCEKSTADGFVFGCLFTEPATDDLSDIRANLTPEPENAVDDDHEDGKNKTKTGISKFEKTVRTLSLISIIATILIVVLVFIIVILVALKVFNK